MRIPELVACPEAGRLIASADFQRELEQLRAERVVEPGRIMKLKRQVLESLAARFFSEPSDRRNQFEQYLTATPELDTYARFRSACEQLGRPWTKWPAPQRDGDLRPAADDPSYRYHTFAQWIIHEQLEDLVRVAQSLGTTWYLDMPLGTNPDGYDVWRYRDVFALGAELGLSSRASRAAARAAL
jgi:4-alpha-glucanotransferase